MDLDIYDRVRLQNNAKDIMYRVEIWTKSNQLRRFNLSLITVRRPNYPSNCFTLDLNDDETIKMAGIKQVFISFQRREHFEAKIVMEDRSLSCFRPIKDHKFYFTGPNVEFTNLGSIFQSYTSTVKQKLFQEILSQSLLLSN